MSNLGERKNAGKPPLSRIDMVILEHTANVLAFGSQKYDWNNWRKGLTYHEVLDSLIRHAFKLADGEDLDKESGLPNVGHIVANAMFLARYMHENRVDLDDRYKGVETMGVFKEINRKIDAGENLSVKERDAVIGSILAENDKMMHKKRANNFLKGLGIGYLFGLTCFLTMRLLGVI